MEEEAEERGTRKMAPGQGCDLPAISGFLKMEKKSVVDRKGSGSL